MFYLIFWISIFLYFLLYFNYNKYHFLETTKKENIKNKNFIQKIFLFYKIHWTFFLTYFLIFWSFLFSLYLPETKWKLLFFSIDNIWTYLIVWFIFFIISSLYLGIIKYFKWISIKNNIKQEIEYGDMHLLNIKNKDISFDFIAWLLTYLIILLFYNKWLFLSGSYNNFNIQIFWETYNIQHYIIWLLFALPIIPSLSTMDRKYKLIPDRFVYILLVWFVLFFAFYYNQFIWNQFFENKISSLYFLFIFSSILLLILSITSLIIKFILKKDIEIFWYQDPIILFIIASILWGIPTAIIIYIILMLTFIKSISLKLKILKNEKFDKEFIEESNINLFNKENQRQNNEMTEVGLFANFTTINLILLLFLTILLK